ncbi:MAG: plasmid partitioning protein RepB [Methylocystis sp.]|nr:plasmid partitioning protein RepB [Methylocystis sp.]MCA3585082.1 plasmid partitioning protein RepB [Methylocystis sp.]MCA3592300.1 plasmid partitioning protein RepB [Methylocystis sp.]
MTRRRDHLKALFAGGEAPSPAAPEAKNLPGRLGIVPAHMLGQPEGQGTGPVQPPRAASSALKAMGLELDGLRETAAEAEALRAQLQAGEAVVMVNPALVDSAFFRDRMESDPADDEALRRSIAESGQQVPILLRPKPGSPGRYEAVYGHRRLAAVKALGREVRAIIRAIDDDGLVIAQGQENNARRDLSFIERARYAAGLESRGFSRATVMAALGVHPADMTRYISVTEAVDGRLIERIGPAPAMGRSRWLRLGEALAAFGKGRQLPPAVEILLESEAFQRLGSNERFNAVLGALNEAARNPAPAGLPSPASPSPARPRQLGPLTLSRAGRGNQASLKLAGSGAGDFADYLDSRLDELYAAHAAASRSAAKD